jgi:hypothetical protein
MRLAVEGQMPELPANTLNDPTIPCKRRAGFAFSCGNRGVDCREANGDVLIGVASDNACPAVSIRQTSFGFASDRWF